MCGFLNLAFSSLSLGGPPFSERNTQQGLGFSFWDSHKGCPLKWVHLGQLHKGWPSCVCLSWEHGRLILQGPKSLASPNHATFVGTDQAVIPRQGSWGRGCHESHSHARVSVTDKWRV